MSKFIGNIWKARRKKKRITLQRMADNLGVSITTYWNWEKGLIPHDKVDGVLFKKIEEILN